MNAPRMYASNAEHILLCCILPLSVQLYGVGSVPLLLRCMFQCMCCACVCAMMPCSVTCLWAVTALLVLDANTLDATPWT